MSEVKSSTSIKSAADSNRSASCYSWGWPDDGRLGIGPPAHDPSKKKKPIHHEVWPHPNFQFTRTDADMIKGVAAGGRHSLFIMGDGTVRCSGWNGHGQCGQKPDVKNYYSPEKVEGLKQSGRDLFIREVSAGHATSYALTGESKVYSWGKGKWGALGHEIMDDEDPEEDQWKPRIIKELINERIVSISAGYQHCVCTTFGCRTFAWGRNNYGQLGLGKEAFDAGWVGKPTEIKWRPKAEIVKRFVAGYNHCAALVEVTRPDKRVEVTAFVWGCHEDSRLGSCDIRMHYIPQENAALTQMVRKNHWVFKDICAGGAHTLVLEKYNGLVVGWGSGQYGQLGYGHVWERADPVMIIGLKFVQKLACGARHSMAVVDRITTSDATDGELYTWGFNDYGELGMGDCNVRLQPHKVNGLINADVIDVAAGHKHSICITNGIAKKVRDLPEYQEYLEILRTDGLLVYDFLKKSMEEKGLNPDYLDTPDLVLPGQPGLENVPAEYDGSEPGMQYCIDTIKNPEDHPVISKIRGPYETTYHCVRCRFTHVCMACARHCHGRHPVRVNFKLRSYNDTCQCCEHDICNIRWSNIRHEFDKLALREEDKCVGIEQIQEVLENCFEDIEERRGGLPLTSKQKEDDLKAATDAMVEKFNKRKEEELGDKADDDLTTKQKERRRKKEEEEKRKKAAKGGRGKAAKSKEEEKKKGEEEEEEEVEKIRVNFKDFEKWN
eukprot:CAMPEP_0118653684 /NCGR_PEP_ID=MMETSP0785-20121206/11957_1 /TAXON_ID=91992 /ORGANISM="Bolidomonas pacifica, Strain CCMP 1866" /LENGTH=721 /DNA_ID=CAMNT_0006546233 /DNA_START=60 /DNA_END=2222 /DNA_ORIENTATION=-